MESLPLIMLALTSWPLLSVSSVRATGQVEGDKDLRVHAEWETAASAKSDDHPGSCPALHALPLPLAEGPFRVHKGDLPYCSRGSTRGPQHDRGERSQPQEP